MKRVLLLVAICLAMAVVPMCAQSTTGIIMGSVTDPSGAVVPAATVTLINADTGTRRVQPTEKDGNFVIQEVTPGRYTIHVEAAGFKQLDKQNINIAASERASVGQLALTVGSASESISVEAEGELVQVASAERSALLTTSQVDNLLEQGRLAIGLLRVLPGIPNPGDGGGLPSINGIPAAYNSMTTDGTPNTELGTTGFSSTRATIDSVQEIKVLTSNYQAEYGTMGGGSIQIITKSGTTQFHGTVYEYKQHEQFDATSFFNNQKGTAKTKNRVDKYGFSIGGPAYIPRVFNADKTKLFFFVNQEFTRQPSMAGTSTFTVPTDLERSGDFSKTLNVSNQVVPIKNPTTGVAYSGNVIPASQINANGLKMLSIFPQPNFTNRAISNGGYNYVIAHNNGLNLRSQQTWRGDYEVSSKIRFYLHGIHELNQEYNWLYQYTTPQIDGLNYIPKNDIGINSTEILSPSLVNTFVFGFHHRTEYRSVAGAADPLKLYDYGALAGYSRAALGVNLPNLYTNNAFNLLPGMSFSDVPSAMGLSWSAGGFFPPTTSELALVGQDSLSKVKGSHTIKVGISATHLLRMTTGSSNVAGSFAFGRDTNNATDSGYGYANALLGNFTSYTEATSSTLTRNRQSIVEWFVQDTWKASRKLTVDVGVRFSWFTPWTQGSGLASNFEPALWKASAAPVLFAPTLVGGKRLALNPLTGATAPATEIGALVPNSGDPGNGALLQSAPGAAPGFLSRQGILWAPRLGLAYDLSGKGKTALRMGAGVSHNVETSNVETTFVANPPVSYAPTIYYGSLTNYANTSGVLFPSAVRGYQLAGQAPTIYSYSAGIQHSIGLGMTLDVAYVGNLTRHAPTSQSLNTLAPGTRFLASSMDPTQPGKPLPDTFLAPYRGYGTVTLSDRSGNANYNSMQTQLNRRFSRGVQFGVSWTWSHALDAVGALPMFTPVHLYAYGRSAGDTRHIVVTNWVYALPKGSVIWSNFLTKAVLDGWQLTGIATFQTGAPVTIGFSTTTGADRTGGGDAQRIDLVAGADPLDVPGGKTFYKQINTAAFSLPAIGSIGDFAAGTFSGLGFLNFDLSLGKEFKMKERFRLKIMAQAFNAFNHTEFSGYGTSAQFNPATNAQTSTTFGVMSAARSPRQMEMTARITF